MRVIFRLINKSIILLLSLYCLAVIIGFFAGYSITFPFSLTEGRFVPEHRLHAIRLATLGTFFYFSIYHLFFSLSKLYPIQFIAVFLCWLEKIYLGYIYLHFFYF